MKSSFPPLHLQFFTPCYARRHARPSGRGFAVREREVADADASTSLDHARESPDRGLDFDLTSLTSLNPSVSGG